MSRQVYIYLISFGSSNCIGVSFAAKFILFFLCSLFSYCVRTIARKRQCFPFYNVPNPCLCVNAVISNRLCAARKKNMHGLEAREYPRVRPFALRHEISAFCPSFADTSQGQLSTQGLAPNCRRLFWSCSVSYETKTRTPL